MIRVREHCFHSRPYVHFVPTTDIMEGQNKRLKWDAVCKKTHFLRFSQGFALHLPGILHQQNTKINIINDPEVFRLSVAIQSTTKTYLFTPHPDHTNCLYALVRIRYQYLCLELRFMSDRASTLQRNIFFITLLTFTGTR